MTVKHMNGEEMKLRNVTSPDYMMVGESVGENPETSTSERCLAFVMHLHTKPSCIELTYLMPREDVVRHIESLQAWLAHTPPQQNAPSTSVTQ